MTTPPSPLDALNYIEPQTLTFNAGFGQSFFASEASFQPSVVSRAPAEMIGGKALASSVRPAGGAEKKSFIPDLFRESQSVDERRAGPI